MGVRGVVRLGGRDLRGELDCLALTMAEAGQCWFGPLLTLLTDEEVRTQEVVGLCRDHQEAKVPFLFGGQHLGLAPPPSTPLTSVRVQDHEVLGSPPTPCVLVLLTLCTHDGGEICDIPDGPECGNQDRCCWHRPKTGAPGEPLGAAKGALECVRGLWLPLLLNRLPLSGPGKVQGF